MFERVFVILGGVEFGDHGLDGRGARNVLLPDGYAPGGRFEKRWEPVWLRLGDAWRVGILRAWIKQGPGEPWLVQVDYGKPDAYAGWRSDWFVYDPRHIRPLDAAAPPD